MVFSLSLSTQMRVLVIEPLKRAAPSLSLPVAAIVDGVDACGPSGKSQSDLLQQLGTVASELQHLPLIFIVASRPEYDIREAFNGPHLSSLTETLVLDDSYRPDDDIKLYFDSAFHEIYERMYDLAAVCPLHGQTTATLTSSCRKPLGSLFSRQRSPNSSILLVTIPSIALTSSCASPVRNDTAFEPLDALYRFILGSVADVEQVLEVLTLLLLQRGYNRELISTRPRSCWASISDAL
ncbi:hypothetical protein BJ912DRAFT_649941 [Pholiota molesta]|nr:hypothetical protein BJ912DRAFT_649941 [Pholiota molesta]